MRLLANWRLPSLAAWSLLSLTLCMASTAKAESQITLVDNGASDYAIVVDKDALATPKFAAQELQTYIFKATGAKLPIAAKPVEGKKSVFVGESSFTKALGASCDSLPPEGFLIHTVGDSLVIAGNDTAGEPINMHWRTGPQTGTLYGVCDFLERQLGVRWYIPGPLGEVVPKTKTVAFGQLDISDSPAFVNRNVHFISAWHKTSNDEYLWLRRNRVGRSAVVSHSHNWWYVIPCAPSPKGWPSWLEPRKPYFDHPEYYALVDGNRKMTHSVVNGDAKRAGEICTSNPDVIRIFAETAVDWFKKHPDETMFSISWNDGAGSNFCQCENCRALDCETLPDGSTNYNDRLIAFYNAVGKLVAEKCPGKQLGAYVYYGGDLPKRQTEVEKNVWLWNVYNGCALGLYNQKYRAKMEGQIAAWRKLCENFSFYTAFQNDSFWGFPYSGAPVLTELFPFLKSKAIKAVEFFGDESWGGNGMDIYLASRLSWNPSLDSKALIDDYYNKFYGAAAGAKVRAYHELLQESARKLAATMGTMENPDSMFRKDMIALLYGPIRPQARKLLDEALAASPDSAVRERVMLASDAFRLVELTLDAMDSYQTAFKNMSPENTTKFKNAVDARESFLESHKSSLAIVYNIVKAYDRNESLPVRPEIAEYLLTSGGKKKLAECRKASVSPDGALDAACWRQVAALPSFVQNGDGSAAQFKSEARMLYDDKNLYLELVCKDSAPSQLLAAIKERNGKVWNENEIEIFIDAKRDGKSVRHLLFNSLGTQCDVKHENGKESMVKNGKWTVKTALLPDGWSAAVAIPFEDLGAGAPIPGDIWSFNICRVRRNASDIITEYSALSPTFGLFYRPDRFADLVFK